MPPPPVVPIATPSPIPPPVLSAATSPEPSSAPAAMVTETPPAAESRSSNGGSRTWIWIAVGAAVVAGGAVALLLATRSDKFPDASFGTATGN